MPTYVVTAPDGREYEVDAPDGATQEQVLAYAQQNYQQPQDDIPTLPAVQAELPDPSEGGGSLQIAGFDTGIPLSQGATRGLAGFGKALVDTGRGLKQAGTDAARYFVEEGLGMEAPGLRASLASQQAEIDAARERDAPLMQTGAGLGGNVAGYASQIMVPGGILGRGAALGRAALPTTIAGNTAQGGVLGMLQPVASDETRAGATGQGAVFGAGGATLAKLVGAGVRGARSGLSDLIQKAQIGPAAQRAGQVIRQEAGDLASLFRPAQSAVPGVTRTLGEESLDPGTMALENAMRAKYRGQFDPVDMRNNVSRVEALRGIAGDDAAMAGARQARSAAANPLRREAMQIDGVDTNRLLGQIKRLEKAQEGRPAVQQGLGQIRQLLTREVPDSERMAAAIKPLQDFIANDRISATNREAAKAAIAQIKAGEWPSASFITGGKGTAGVGASYDAAKSALSQARKALEKTAVGHDKVPVLDNVRKTIGDMLSGKYGGDSAASLAGSRELMAVKNQLDRVLEKAAPQYGQYIDAFRSGSVPINRMELGRDLIERGSASVRDATGTPRLMPGTFAKANDLDTMAQKATGFAKAKASDILTADDLKLISAVQDDLQRQFARQSSATAGSQTFERGEIGKRVVKRGLSALPFGIGSFAEGMQKAGADRVQEKLAYLLANPDEARRVLQALEPAQRSAVTQALSQMAAQGARTGSVALGQQ